MFFVERFLTIQLCRSRIRKNSDLYSGIMRETQFLQLRIKSLRISSFAEISLRFWGENQNTTGFSFSIKTVNLNFVHRLDL